jgi:hypothetical protein
MQRTEGNGKLRGIRTPMTEFDVLYEFTIVEHVIRRPGFPPAPGHTDTGGTVRSINGQFIPEGIYQLETEDGQSLRVTNLGLGEWRVLASP